ncbi:MAG: hypothetical protein D6806_10545 [Deltaproteobacteria bacterium]|nr:MAG: hypothetical protein D6806_10545 [Deltaproteobacteria bacterium]
MAPSPIRLCCLPAGLATLDRLQAELLVLLPFEEDRPLQGTAGLCDWRLNGRINRLVEQGWYRPSREQALLMDSAGRIPTSRVLVLGMGKRAALDAQSYRRRISCLAGILGKLRYSSVALELPDLAQGPMETPQLQRALFELVANHLPGARLFLLCPYPRAAEFAKEVAGDMDQVVVEERGAQGMALW